MISYKEAAHRMRKVAKQKSKVIKITKELWLEIASMFENAEEEIIKLKNNQKRGE